MQLFLSGNVYAAFAFGFSTRPFIFQLGADTKQGWKDGKRARSVLPPTGTGAPQAE